MAKMEFQIGMYGTVGDRHAPAPDSFKRNETINLLFII